MNNMKKKIITLVIVLLFGVGAFFIGKSYYYNNLYNYSRVINESLEKYYISSKTEDLMPIGKTIALYKENDEKRGLIQEKVYSIFNDWVVYLNNKYLCDSNNVNSCRLLYSELVNLKNSIGKAAVADGEQIIASSKYDLLITDIELKMEEIKDIIDDPSSVRPRNYEESRLEKCNKVVECPDECRYALCECTFINSQNKRETVLCKNKKLEENK